MSFDLYIICVREKSDRKAILRYEYWNILIIYSGVYSYLSINIIETQQESARYAMTISLLIAMLKVYY